tara:strand:- start:316 stop:456 length:141 start_codon:yes stop_codon:yes gene_type:complete
MGWGNCEDHYSRVAKELAKRKPMSVRTKSIIVGWIIFLISIIWLLK